MSGPVLLLGGDVDRLPARAAHLVKTPYGNYNPWTSNGYGTATVASGQTNIDNPDGSGYKATFTVAGAVGNHAVLRGVVHGRVVGVRVYRGQTLTPPNFDVVIDGVAYPVDDTIARQNNVALGANDSEAVILIADNLPDRAHTVEVHLTADIAGAASRTLVLYGWVVEAGRGYQQYETNGYPTPNGGTAITTTATQISFTNRVMGLSFRNGDSVTRTVVITDPGGTATYKTVSLAAGADATVTFARPRNLGGVKWKTGEAGGGNLVLGWVEQ